MNFWEGAILVVGGVWLVGRMSRQSAAHPVNRVPNTYQAQVPTLPNATNTARTNYLVTGETLAMPDPVALPPRIPVTPISGTRLPIRMAPVLGASTARVLV